MSTPANFTCIIAAGLLLLSACSTTAITPATTDASAPATGTGETIWVLDSGWHTALVLRRSQLGTQFIALLQPLPETPYLTFGWGNRKFYRAPHPTLGMDIAALFPSQSTVLVEGCAQPPRACYTRAVKIRALPVTVQGAQRLDAYLLATFQRNAAGQAKPLGPGPDPGSEFYASRLSYDALHTCNTWTAEALQVAGLPITYHGIIFAGQLWRELPRTPA